MRKLLIYRAGFFQKDVIGPFIISWYLIYSCIKILKMAVALVHRNMLNIRSIWIFGKILVIFLLLRPIL